MRAYAQTNLQLLRQLRDGGYSDQDLARIKDAYDVATHLYTGWIRPSGKPFLAHVVGTASILATVEAPATVVAAGLLHAAYTIGGRGAVRPGVSRAKRALLRRAVGGEVEELVLRYTALRWDETTIPRVHRTVPTLDATARQVLTIRLANELEDHLDGSLHYCPALRRQLLGPTHRLAVDMAAKLGLHDLAADLARAIEESASGEVPEPLQTHRTASVFISPASHRRRLGVLLRDHAGAVLRRLGRRPRP